MTRRQALKHGVTPQVIRHAVGPRGRWQRVVSGVYATFTGPLTERHIVRAALLYAGHTSMVSGAVACRAFGMTYAPSSSGVLLLVPKEVQRAKVPIAHIRRVKVAPQPRTIRGFRCAPPERAVLDSVRGAGHLSDVRAALTEVVQRGLSTPDRLVAEFDADDRRGLKLAGLALEDVRAGCWSAPESELRDLIAQGTFPEEPIWNQPLPDAPDLVPDLQFRQARLAIEVDSMQWHFFGDAVERTESKRARYAQLGWRCLPVLPRRIYTDGRALLAEIETAAAVRA